MKRLTISGAARAIGVSPATIRNYEARGYFKPKRDRNNCRYFLEEDIQALEKILFPEGLI